MADDAPQAPMDAGAGTRTAGPAGRRRRSPSILLTWAAVALVLVIVVVLVVVKLASSTAAPTTLPAVVPAPGGLVSEVTSIPHSVYDTVGVDSPAVAVTPPAAVSGKAKLTFDGKPGVFWFGAEFCPYCAADRWALVASLARFGHFDGLGLIRSSSSAAPAGIESFTFRGSTFTSPYVSFDAVEQRSVFNPTGAGYTWLQQPDPQESELLSGFHVTGYPFVDFGNQFVSPKVSYSPTFLSGLTWDQIGSALNDPTQPETRAIVALSNYFSAATCAVTGGRPGSVCDSKGVTAAARAMHQAPGR